MLAQTTSRSRFTCAKLHQLPNSVARARFLQTLPLPATPLRSDSLPRERGEVGDKHRLGLPASLGKQKKLRNKLRSFFGFEIKLAGKTNFFF
jgi:hypothetical protein